VVGSAIKAGGSIDQFPPSIWEIAFTGNEAQFARNLSVMRGVKGRARLNREGCGHLATSLPAFEAGARGPGLMPRLREGH